MVGVCLQNLSGAPGVALSQTVSTSPSLPSQTHSFCSFPDSLLNYN